MRTAHRTSGTRERLPVAGNRHEVADHLQSAERGDAGAARSESSPSWPASPRVRRARNFLGDFTDNRTRVPVRRNGGGGGPPAVAPRSPHLADGTKVDVDSAHVPPCRGGENGGEARAPYAQGGLEDRAAAPARVARRVAPQQGNERDGVRAVGRARGRPWLSSWPVRGRTHVRTHTPPTGGQQGPSATHVITRGTGDGGRPATPIPP
jgi:hypothetical protein